MNVHTSRLYGQHGDSKGGGSGLSIELYGVCAYLESVYSSMPFNLISLLALFMFKSA